MKKSEIKQEIKSIVNAINIARGNTDEYLQPYKDIQVHIEAMQEIEESIGIETGIDFETVLNDTLRSCINISGDIEEINNEFDILLADLDNWQSESSDKKGEEIQEKYIDVLSEIKESYDINSIECSEDLDNQLCDIITGLEDIII